LANSKISSIISRRSFGVGNLRHISRSRELDLDDFTLLVTQLLNCNSFKSAFSSAIVCINGSLAVFLCLRKISFTILSRSSVVKN